MLGDSWSHLNIYFSRYLPCLGLIYKSWSTFVGCSSSDSPYSAVLVCFFTWHYWDSLLNPCWYNHWEQKCTTPGLVLLGGRWEIDAVPVGLWALLWAYSVGQATWCQWGSHSFSDGIACGDEGICLSHLLLLNRELGDTGPGLSFATVWRARKCRAWVVLCSWIEAGGCCWCGQYGPTCCSGCGAENGVSHLVLHLNVWFWHSGPACNSSYVVLC